MNKYLETASTLKSLNIEHPAWNRALELSYSHIAMAAPSEVVCIIGPSRVGKSRLSLALRKILNPPGIGIGDVNSLSIGVRASNCNTNGAFSTKAFARKAVTALQHPIFGINSDDDTKKINSRVSEGELWLALERGLPAAGKRYVFIDEAQNIIRAVGRNGPGAILDAWKVVAEDANVVLVLTGTYSLHAILPSAPHVVGRKGVIHFPRYQITQQDIKGFIQILKTYNSYLPLGECIGELSRHIKFLYSGSLGCIGLLERWLRNALSIAMADKSDITMYILSKPRLCDTDLKLLSDDITAGEQLLAIDDLLPPEMSALGTENKSAIKNSKKVRSVTKATNSNSPKRNDGHKRKPFTCKPVRRTTSDRIKGDIDV